MNLLRSLSTSRPSGTFYNFGKFNLCSKTDISKTAWINAWPIWAKVINILSQVNWFIFGKKMTNTLEMSTFLKYHWGKSKQFSTKKVNAIATKKSSCFISLILVNLVANLTVSHSPSYTLSVVYYFWSFTICPSPFNHIVT